MLLRMAEPRSKHDGRVFCFSGRIRMKNLTIICRRDRRALIGIAAQKSQPHEIGRANNAVGVTQQNLKWPVFIKPDEYVVEWRILLDHTSRMIGDNRRFLASDERGNVSDTRYRHMNIEKIGTFGRHDMFYLSKPTERERSI